ncbi:YitT family protein [[Clostridium] hylemonae]|uniref:YitT family protein n=1 Tax=[Clostridium] hylemonae TaxID=89153 RepID=UPI001FCAD4BA|nr:YitT family protein [[Clostridium] hylemonae]BDF03511.1 membrane protein [[Clostridium] hylemonae]
MKKNMKIVLGVLAGNAILALAVAAFVVPHGIIMGGATGIGLAVTHYVPLNLSVVIFIVNAILFVLGACMLGRKFALTTIISTFVYPVFLEIARKIPGVDSLTDNILLATVYGGLLLGLGIGLVVRQGASTGGTDILALVLNKFLHGPVAVFMYIVDFTVLGAQIFFSDSEQVLYGVLALMLMTMVMNRVVLFGQTQIQLFIISEKHEEIRQRILKDMNVGATMVHIETGYGKEQQKGVLCVIPHRKLYAVNDTVSRIDDKAFTTITQIKEVKGRGFTMERVSYHGEER